jgi:hypothetical protein
MKVSKIIRTGKGPKIKNDNDWYYLRDLALGHYLRASIKNYSELVEYFDEQTIGKFKIRTKGSDEYVVLTTDEATMLCKEIAAKRIVERVTSRVASEYHQFIDIEAASSYLISGSNLNIIPTTDNTEHKLSITLGDTTHDFLMYKVRRDLL